MNGTDQWPGKPYPLGANWDGRGTNFSIFSENAESIELLLFDSDRTETPSRVVKIKERTASSWHCYLPDIAPGQLYAYRVYGRYEPEKGHRFNPAKALIDPYAKAICGDLTWDDSLFGYSVGDPAEDLSRDDRSNLSSIPRSVVVDTAYDWEGDDHLNIPWNETVIYEAHVKGLTFHHPDLPQNMRGTYSGLGSEPVIAHLKSLGISAIELLPVQHHVMDRHLLDKGLSDYWGYNTIGFFAPDSRYASSGCTGEQVREFKEMVKALHRAGIEVIIDVAYNHTAEGNHSGPTLCFKGIDNLSYYSLLPGEKRHYYDFSGCGGCFNMSHPRVLQFVMDSLRYWVSEMHVDGFRFDLAATLAREFYVVDRLATFFDVICQDPILSRVKLIAEPWDLGPGGYQVGNFPEQWAEWNGKYRDTIRRFWKGDEGQLSELGFRLTGSSDLYQGSRRNPQASINFITCHDGFTLRDLVSYNEKHNEDNAEENRDGLEHNDSWNCGAEGPTDDVEIRTLRMRQMKNLMATLLLSQGTPMMLSGDEFAASKNGNNNSYCQDNEINWLDWHPDEEGWEMVEFIRNLIRIRKSHPILRRKSFFQGKKLTGKGVKDIHWIKPDGKEMKVGEWKHSFARSLGMLLVGDAMEDVDEHGNRILDDSFLILLNAYWEPVEFILPRAPGGRWRLLFDTNRKEEKEPFTVFHRKLHYMLTARSLAVFTSPLKGG